MNLTIRNSKNGFPRLGIELSKPPTFVRLEIKFLYWSFQFDFERKKKK